MKTEKATFAGGCFWHIQFEFSEMPGVLNTVAGYTGGEFNNPTYKEVCSGETGHVESVEIEYDKEKISYDSLLESFFKIHDPTTIDKQGPDRGSQYNSSIFYHNSEQKRKAEKYKERLIKNRINAVTKIKKAGKFWPAEDYHQNYYIKNGIRACKLN